jgi:uncharacterized protein YcaQ
VERLTIADARRLALARAGLLKPRWSGFPAVGAGSGARARAAALAVIDRFGYLQLDTVSIAGARSHVLVLLSRLEGFDRSLGESLLAPGEPLFEYWGHEACWIPHDLYPAFAFRRSEFKQHPWWGDVIGAHPKTTRALVKRIRAEGGLRSIDLEGAGSQGWWDLKLAKRVATALWSSGELSIRERNSFQRCFDVTERVIPKTVRTKRLSKSNAFEVLLLKALDGHGFASVATLASTWRLRNCRTQIQAALRRLEHRNEVQACQLQVPGKRAIDGWIRPRDLELSERLRKVRPRGDRGVCLSPFDPVLWDRDRVRLLFDFDQVLEIYKPASIRKYGYFCLPVLAGERLIARFDFKAERKQGLLKVLSVRFEDSGSRKPTRAIDEQAARSALQRFGKAVGLEPVGW